MYKGLLPILIASIFLSCTKPAGETSSAPDSSAVGELPPNEDPANDTAYDGNTDGDFFFNDTSIAVITEGDVEEGEVYEEEEPEKEVAHTQAIDVCGFSDDGKYFAFTQTSIVEGHKGTSLLFVLDVEKNEWATKPLSYELREETLSKYGITFHKNIGEEFDIQSDNTIKVNGVLWAVVLTVDPNRRIEVRVNDATTKSIVLQKDTKVPASRGNVRRYQLNKAHVFGDRIAAFIEYDSEIIHGSNNNDYYDRKYIAVTGVVK